MRLAAATAIVIALTAATGCGGETAAHHSQYLYMQKCASCHGISADAKTPVRNATNLLDPANRPQLEQVRRAIIDGRPGMPKGLLGGSDVDQIAAYLSGETK
ncbi:MAG TPA: cytochrome c [Gaiellales bacterium]|jgi:mono/diheme cytochrome c family protein|nr:cytochrome c [Gaiellales bacterium]